MKVCLFFQIHSESAWNGRIDGASTIFIGHLSCFTPSGVLHYICIFVCVFFIAFFTNIYLFSSLKVVIRLFGTEGATPHCLNYAHHFYQAL